MIKLSKVGTVIAILAIPALLGLLGYIYTHQHANLKVYFARDSVKVGGAYQVTSADEIPPFTFTDQNGKIFSSAEHLKGKIYVADFIFTNCPGICPKMTGNLQKVQESFAGDSDFHIVSFTVDPERDSVETLNKYAEKYHADYSKWHFLTGSKDSIYNLAQKNFRIVAGENDDDPLDFVHSERLILVDKNGWVRGYYNGTKAEDIDKLIEEIRVLKYIYESEGTHSKE